MPVSFLWTVTTDFSFVVTTYSISSVSCRPRRDGEYRERSARRPHLINDILQQSRSGRNGFVSTPLTYSLPMNQHESLTQVIIIAGSAWLFIGLDCCAGSGGEGYLCDVEVVLVEIDWTRTSKREGGMDMIWIYCTPKREKRMYTLTCWRFYGI